MAGQLREMELRMQRVESAESFSVEVNSRMPPARMQEYVLNVQLEEYLPDADRKNALKSIGRFLFNNLEAQWKILADDTIQVYAPLGAQNRTHQMETALSELPYVKSVRFIPLHRRG
ncbi:hypothetical protein NKJ06_31075 [Mesorhizobium sp. M0293]|uniref:hypothetical protein n=1 Tax=unclassified Mesorhizobium TaxID=325217 RepID=UPI00333A7290